MTGVVVATVAVLLVLGLATALADRVCAARAERTAAAYLSAPFDHPAAVRVHGLPFLTQALRGRYRDIEVSGGGLQVGDMSGATLNAHLYQVLLPPRVLVRGRAQALPCQRVEGRLVLPYGELARASRIPGLTLSFRSGRLVASASVPVPGINQLARVSGHALLSVVGDGTVWLRVRGLSVAGISLPGVVISQLLPVLSVPIPIPPLPYGLRVDDLTPVPSGLLVCASADRVVFGRHPDPAI